MHPNEDATTFYCSEVMSTPLSYEEVYELLPAYALGALDERERAIVQAYLDRYPELRAEVARYGGVLHSLAATVPQRTPPASLKASLIAQAQRTSRPPARRSIGDRLLDAFLGPRFVWGVVSGVLLLLLSLFAVQTARLSAQVARLERVLGEQQRLVRLLATGSEQLTLNGTDAAPQAVAVVRYNPGERWAALEAHRLPPLPESRTYQLWLTNAAGERWSGAMFRPDDAGSAVALVWCPQPMDEILRFGVSIEPFGGSPAPTGPNVLRGVRS